jgi:hypothetical protein
VATCFVKKYSALTVPCERTYPNSGKTLKERFSTGQKEKRNRYDFTEEKLDDIGAQMETSFRKYLRRLGLQSRVQNPRTLSKYDIQCVLSKSHGPYFSKKR